MSNSVKSKCENCPRLIHDSLSLAILSRDRSVAANSIMGDGTAENLVALKRTLEERDLASIDFNVSDEEFVAGFRREIGVKVIEVIDEDRDALKEDMERLVTNCDGPIKMRATKNRREYTVTICGSPSQEDDIYCKIAHYEIKTHQ